MELIAKGQFYRDVNTGNRNISEAVHGAIRNVTNAKNISQIQNLKKLDNYKLHYRIRVADDYRIGVIIRGGTVWFTRFGHRSIFYKKLFP